MLYLIGIGLGTPQDITLQGLNCLKKCDKVYLEAYTSQLVDYDHAALEQAYGVTITPVDRDFLETQADEELITPAQNKNIALLIVGSPLGATTHVDLLTRANKHDVQTTVIDNASILTTVGSTGLSLYKFGRTVTVPEENTDVTSTYDFMIKNKEIGLHTLVLLDLKNINGTITFMTARDGLDYFIRCGLKPDTEVIVCGGLGSGKQEIHVGAANAVTLQTNPQCFIIPGALHFMEEEALSRFQ